MGAPPDRHGSALDRSRSSPRSRRASRGCSHRRARWSRPRETLYEVSPVTRLHLRPDDIPAAEGIVLAIGERLLRIPPEHVTIASRLVGLRHPFSAEDAAMLAGVSTGEMQATIEALVGEQVLVRLDA